jgi:hypothetical protein
VIKDEGEEIAIIEEIEASVVSEGEVEVIINVDQEKIDNRVVKESMEITEATEVIEVIEVIEDAEEEEESEEIEMMKKKWFMLIR